MRRWVTVACYLTVVLGAVLLIAGIGADEGGLTVLGVWLFATGVGVFLTEWWRVYG